MVLDKYAAAKHVFQNYPAIVPFWASLLLLAFLLCVNA